MEQKVKSISGRDGYVYDPEGIYNRWKIDLCKDRQSNS